MGCNPLFDDVTQLQLNSSFLVCLVCFLFCRRDKAVHSAVRSGSWRSGDQTPDSQPYGGDECWNRRCLKAETHRLRVQQAVFDVFGASP